MSDNKVKYIVRNKRTQRKIGESDTLSHAYSILENYRYENRHNDDFWGNEDYEIVTVRV